MHNRFYLAISLILGFTSLAFPQRPQDGTGFRMEGTVEGRIYNSTTNRPVEYATVILYSQSDSSQASGAVTDSEGGFQLTGLKPGLYYLQISFMGFDLKTVEEIGLFPGSMQVDLGGIAIEPAMMEMDAVEIEVERPPIEFKIDKKVVNVGQHYTAASGTAVDVLENVPSITVDIEGNVKLRGSGNFSVLIDGRPSVLESNEALQQIPASTIDNIEIITNPSAKYEPDGTSGIINIILKKNKFNGTGGIVNLDSGLDDKYGADFIINHRSGKTNTTFGADFNHRFHPGTMEGESYSIFNDTTYHVDSDGTNMRGRTNYGLRGSIEYGLTENDFLTLGGRYGMRKYEWDSDLDYHQWSDLQPPDYYENINTSEHSGDFVGINLDYLHKYRKKNHELSAGVHYHYREMNEESVNELKDASGKITSGSKTTEDGPGERLSFQIDYRLPINESDKIEAGYQGRIGSSKDLTGLYDYTQGGYVFQPEYSHEIKYYRDIHALYSLYSGERGNFGFQGGLRGEYTYRDIELIGENDAFHLERWDYFPTVHFSYKLPAQQQVMASYTRRIERPRGYYFEPFRSWMDAFNVRVGNPGLKPEYIDSYEIGYNRMIGKNHISVEGFHRVTHNHIERVRSVYLDSVNVILHSIENVGSAYDTGIELMTSLKPSRFWEANLMGSLFNRRIEGVSLGKSFDNEDYNWQARLNNTIKVAKSTRLQFNASYHSPTVSSQGTIEGFFTANLALKHEFIKDKLSATLQLHDVFSTASREMTFEGSDFYSHSIYARKAPMVMLNISYQINNYREKKRREGDENLMDEGEEY